MKDLNLLVWLTQLGLSVVAPFAGAVLLSLWLIRRYQLGQWVLWVGIVFGLLCAIGGFRSSLKTMEQLAKPQQEEKPPVSFNDHD